MNLDPIYSVAADLTPVAQRETGATATNFAQWLAGEFTAVNQEIIAADDGVRRLAIGEPVSLHQVMINLERAKLRFELVLQVRNKLLDAYQDLMRMQI